MKKIVFLLGVVFILFASASQFLLPKDAFKPSAKLDNKNIKVTIKLGDEIYIYKNKLDFKLKDNPKVIIDKVIYPKAVQHNGDEVYFKNATFLVKLKNSATQKEKISLDFSYQGCSEMGICYEPTTESYSFELKPSKLENSTNNPKIKEDVSSLSQSDLIAKTIKNSSLIVILITFFGFGLLLSLTPCVFPMIPIISGMIISHGKGLSTTKAFMLSLVYVISMSVAYTIAGVMAGLFGSNIQVALQTPWVIYTFSAIFVALAFSMFGFYELKLPDSLVSKASSKSNKGGYMGVAIMGFLSALIVGPCVAAPLAGALVYIGQTGDALLGGLALFSMGIGMGIPLILVGVSAGKFMPKPGAWMTMVSAIFGVMMLGVAIWMVEKIVDFSIIMILYAMLGLGFSIYLGALESGGHIFKKSVAVILFIYSLSLFIGVLGGSNSMLKPLSFLQSTTIDSIDKKQDGLKFQVVQSIPELDKLLAKNKGKKIMLDFSAKWCTSCKELDEKTFKDPKVIKALSDYVLIRADVTSNSKENKQLSEKYGVFGPPVIIFFDKKLKIINSKTIVGFENPSEFLSNI